MKSHQIPVAGEGEGASPAEGPFPAAGVAFLGALAAGTLLRALLVARRPLWADEVFTLLLARLDLPALLEALRRDSGPPLHYVAAHLLLVPFPVPGPADVLVRLLSLAASLAHLPVLLAVARRTAHPRPRLAAALFALLPLAVAFGAEGRAYALASFLVLLTFERALAVADGAGRGAVAGLGLLSAAALLAHYLAAAAVVGAFAAAAARARSEGRRRLLHGALLAALLALPWMPVALAQPRASMAWVGAASRAERLAAVLANLGLGVSPPPSLLLPAAVAGTLLAVAGLGAGLLRRSPSALVLAGALPVLAGLEAATGAVLLPDRSAALLVPYAALLASELSVPAAGALLALAVLGNGVAVPGALRPNPSQQLGDTLAGALRPGGRVVAAGLWGPELSYRLARAGLPGRVTLFPHGVADHPGWWDERSLDPRSLEREARAVLLGAPPARFAVFTAGTPTGEALRAALAPRGAFQVASTPAFEIWAIPAGP